MSRLILGTANFGRDYGISNQNKITIKSIEKIINLAQSKGVNHFDTAKAYGDSERILGKFLNKSQPLYIDTKIAMHECDSVNSIVDAVKDSLCVLGVQKLHTLYLHDVGILLGDNSLVVRQGMEKVLNLGLADSLGVSVYTFKELKKAKLAFPLLTTFQILENICDRRLINLREIVDFTKYGNIINIRSVFLQGLLLMDYNNLPPKLHEAIESIESLNKYARENCVSVLDLCLAYINKIPWVNSFMVGVESSLQLSEIIKSSFILNEDWEVRISPLPDKLKDPRFW